MLIIGSQDAMYTMQAFAKSPATKPGNLPGHRLTRPKDLVQCESMLVINSTHQAQIPDNPQKTGVGKSQEQQ